MTVRPVRLLRQARRLRKPATLAFAAAVALAGARASAYPGGTPSYQTDVAPFCAGCHSSRDASELEGAGERATKELVENKHLAVIRAADPRSGYAALSEAERATLIAHIEALDRASTVRLEAPERVAPGATFTVTVSVTGGAGPVVGVALVDRAHRWYARPAASAGWQVVAPPQVRVGGEAREEWLDKRPADMGRNLSFVNVPGIHSDASKGEFASAEVTFTLRAPAAAGALPLAAAYLYGTEKGSPLGTVTDAMGRKGPRGGLGGGSGRVLFTPVTTVRVE
jgi:hypothetical protein